MLILLAAVQLILPLGLLSWLAVAPLRSMVGHWLQLAATGLILLALLGLAVVAEDKANAHALEFKNFAVALHFLTEWPDPATAGRRVLQCYREVDGNAYWLLDSAARSLEGKKPLAASLLRRAMIEDTLNGAKSKRYRHAARHLAECRALVGAINDYGAFGNHDIFVEMLHAAHGRKRGF